MRKYRHKPTEVEAVQILKPYRAFKAAFPRHHENKLPTGRLAYFHLVDAEGGSKAYPGDYVVKISGDGPAKVLIMSEEEFNHAYEEVENG